MKLALASLALIVLAAPAAMAQSPFVGNTAVVGAQINSQHGKFNSAGNSVAISQRGSARSTPSFGYPMYSDAAPAFAPTPEPGELIHSLFGPGPLVNNNIAIGTQLNVQNGSGNSAANVLEVGQSASGSGAGGGLINNNLGIGTQLNLQNGVGNSALNGIGIDQSASSRGGLGLGFLPPT